MVVEVYISLLTSTFDFCCSDLFFQSVPRSVLLPQKYHLFLVDLWRNTLQDIHTVWMNSHWSDAVPKKFLFGGGSNPFTVPGTGLLKQILCRFFPSLRIFKCFMQVSGFELSLHGSCLKPAGFLIAYAVSRNGLRTFDLQEPRSGFNLCHDIEGKVTPSKTNMEPKNCWFVDVSPFSKGVFSGSMLVFGGVAIVPSIRMVR